MTDPILITQAYATHEDIDGDFFIAPVTDTLIGQVYNFHSFQASLPKVETAGIQFFAIGFNLINYPYDDQIAELFDSVLQETDWHIAERPEPWLTTYLSDDSVNLRTDLKYLGFIPGNLNYHFRFECHRKDTPFKFTSPMIPMKNLLETFLHNKG